MEIVKELNLIHKYFIKIYACIGYFNSITNSKGEWIGWYKRLIFFYSVKIIVKMKLKLLI